MTPTTPIDPVLNTPTVVGQDDATWIPLGSTPLGDVTIQPALAEEFSTFAQVAALLGRMRECGINPDQLKISESSNNWNYPPFKRLVYLHDSGPQLYTIKGIVTTDDGVETYLDENVGAFINKQRLKGLNQPPGVTSGDFIRLKMVNPFFPWLYWSAV